MDKPLLQANLFKDMVNKLRDCGATYHAHQSLRERISCIVHEYILPASKAQVADFESLRAWKAEIEKQEPVGEIVRTETSHGCDRTAISWFKYPYAKYGARLYLSPVVSPDVATLIADHNADMAACHEQFMEVSREVMSLKAELESAREDAELYRWICSDDRSSHDIAWLTEGDIFYKSKCDIDSAIAAAIEQAKGA